MNTTGKVIVGFLLGSAIGTAVALLMAPSTGKTTRKNLNKRAKKLVKKIEGVIGREKKRVTQKAAQVGNHAKNGKATVAAR
jgi:gas vesicle protein